MTEDLLRVVVVRKGKVKSTEFLLREGEIGLSMFWKADSPGVDTIIEAVRAPGNKASWVSLRSRCLFLSDWVYV